MEYDDFSTQEIKVYLHLNVPCSQSVLGLLLTEDIDMIMEDH